MALLIYFLSIVCVVTPVTAVKPLRHLQWLWVEYGMEQIIAEELEIERKLKELDSKCGWNNGSNYKVNLRQIKKPEDVNVIAVQEREKALARNAQFLQEVDMQVAKLHTKRLCPLQQKLDDLKAKCGLLPKNTITATASRNNNTNNNNIVKNKDKEAVSAAAAQLAHPDC